MAFIGSIQPVPLPAPQAVMNAVALSLTGEVIQPRTPGIRAITGVQRKRRDDDKEKFEVGAKDGQPKTEGAFEASSASAGAGQDNWDARAAVGPSLAFLAQRIAQELLGQGLAIEPWKQMIDAYAQRLELQARVAGGPIARRLDFSW